MDISKLPISDYVRLYAAISDEKRIEILFTLYPDKHPRSKMLSFNRLKKAVRLGSSTLDYHLKLLEGL